MRVSWCVFRISAAAVAVITAAGAVWASRLSGALCAVCAAVGAAALTYFCLRFRALSYSVEDGVIMIKSGVLIRSRHTLPLGSVLWRTEVRIGKAVLFTVLHTASGKSVLFAALDGGLFGE